MKRITKIIWLGIIAVLFSCNPEDKVVYETVYVEDNTIATTTLTIYPNEWLPNYVKNTWYVEKQIETINANVIDYGYVAVSFLSFDFADEWQPLPYSWPDTDYEETYWYGPGYIVFEVQGPGVMPTKPTADYIYKITSLGY